jgi:membrane-bound lytic murein transglycosylase B
MLPQAGDPQRLHRAPHPAYSLWMLRFAPLPAALLAAFVSVGAVAQTAPAAPISRPATFGACLAEIGREAKGQGIAATTVDQTLAGVQFNARVIELDRAQPEFFQTFWRYMDSRVTEARIQRGRDLLLTHQGLLAATASRYGVPAQYLVAFWGLESNYGQFTGTMRILDSLATLACDERRPAFFKGELIAAVRMVANGDVTRERLLGSWAGAMGQTQFMPSTFLRYATDGDGDGRRELWASLPDVFASSARYLASIGWKAEEPWGREVRLPPGFDYSVAEVGQRRAVTDWAARGVREVDGTPLRTTGPAEAAVIVPGGWRGPAFLVFGNFDVIMRWNRSISYAVAVGHLADRLMGAGPLAAARPADDTPLAKDEILDMQQRFARLGFEIGEADGVVGARTRQATRAFQQRNGLPADGYPTRELLQALRQATTR